MKRAHRDPYGGWWDQQERRNFGEPVHEENEVLGVFSPEQYTHVTSRKAFFQVGGFVAAFLGLCGVVSLFYPDRPSAPKTYPDGLEKELGGRSAVPVRGGSITVQFDQPLTWNFRLAKLAKSLCDDIFSCVNTYNAICSGVYRVSGY